LWVAGFQKKPCLLTIKAEAVSQNEQDMLAPLIKWLRVAVTCSVGDANAQFFVACSAPPTMPIMEPAFTEKQRTRAW
jgi:hypothetical protein